MENHSYIFASLYFIYPNTNDTSLYFISTGLSTPLDSELLKIRDYIFFSFMLIDLISV